MNTVMNTTISNIEKCLASTKRHNYKVYVTNIKTQDIIQIYQPNYYCIFEFIGKGQCKKVKIVIFS